jgi:hypothetical protein
MRLTRVTSSKLTVWDEKADILADVHNILTARPTVYVSR